MFLKIVTISFLIFPYVNPANPAQSWLLLWTLFFSELAQGSSAQGLPPPTEQPGTSAFSRLFCQSYFLSSFATYTAIS